MNGIAAQGAAVRVAEVRLFLLDASMSACLALFLTAISTWETPLVDGPILALWAAVPAAVSRFLRSRPWPQRAAGSFLLCLGLVAFAILVGATGWHYISASIDLNLGIDQQVALILLISWASAFFLFLVQTYRLHDALSFGALSIGLVDGRPDGLIWSVAFVVLFFLAAPVRHQLFDIYAYTARPRLDLRHGSPLVLGALILALLVFFGGEFATRSLIGERGSSWGSLSADADDRTIGWNSSFRLSDLGRARESEEPLFAFQIARSSDGRTLEPPAFARENSTLLWRMQVLDQVLHDGSSWQASERGSFAASMRKNTLRFARSRRRTSRYFLLERLSPFSTLVPHLYESTDITLNSSEIEDLSLGKSKHWELSAFDGNQAAAAEGDSIRIGAFTSSRGGAGIAISDLPTPIHRQLPSDAALGFDLSALAVEVFGEARTPARRISKLEAWLQKDFVYDTEATWAERRRQGDTQLKNFLLQTKVGDCTYFSAACCLLLRAGGIDARLVQGFLGYRWDQATRRYVIYEGSAHAWVEWYDKNRGWRPFDGTGYVRKRGVAGRGESDSERNQPLAPTGPQKRSRQSGASPGLFGNVTAEYNQTRLVMTLFGAIGLIFFLSFLRRPRVAPRRNRKVSGLEPGDDKAQPLGLVAPKPQPTADPRLSIIQAYSDWQLDLRRRRSQRAPQETPSEHAARLAADNERWSSQLMEVARTFSAALFGRKIMTHDDLETFLAHLRLLKSRLR